MTFIDTFVDGYWERRRRRALKGRERAHDLALVLDVLMERRGAARRPEGRGRTSPVGQSSAVCDRSEHGSSRTTRESPRTFEQDRSDKHPLQRTKGNEQTGASGPDYSTILVAVDGSEGSRRVGEHAVYLAEKLGARLFILGVVNKHLAFRGGIHYGNIMTELQWECRVAVDSVKKTAGESGVAYEERLVPGQPWEVIVGVAGKALADCIVMGSLRTSLLLETSLLDRALTGGMQRRVIRHAGRPVLIV